MSFAYTNRGQAIFSDNVNVYHDGTKYLSIESKFETKFTDGTIIEITHRTYHIDPINGDLINDSIALFAIKKQ